MTDARESLGKRLYYRIPHQVRYAVDEVLHRRTSLWTRIRAERLAEYDRARSIFVHIPKTGGISVATALYGSSTAWHLGMDSYQKIFNADELDDYFTFCFVRNPWDRLVSAYEFLKRGGRGPADRAWAAGVLARYTSFEDLVLHYLHAGRIFDRDALRPQYAYLTLPGQRDVLVDFVGRYETLEEDFEAVARRLDKEVHLPHLNASRRKDYRAYYTDRLVDRVRDLYQDDVTLFGYEFE